MGPQWTWIPRVHCQDGKSSGPDLEREKRWAELFDQLDVNKDGHIDLQELRKGLAGSGVSKGSLERVRQQDTCLTRAHTHTPVCLLGYLALTCMLLH